MSDTDIRQDNNINLNESSSDSSKSSSGSSHSGHHHHHHHHRKKKHTARNITLILVSILAVLVVISVLANRRDNEDDTSGSSTPGADSSSVSKDGTDLIYVGSSKDKDNRYDFTNVNDAIKHWRTQSKSNELIIVRNTVAAQKIYRVGAGRTLATLIDAVKQWDADGQPTATIFVDSGTYVTVSDPAGQKDPLKIVPTNTNQLNIIGEDKDSTVIKSTTGKYIHPPILIKGGNVTVKNITFIADHSTNSSFTYREKKGYNSAYAVHCDGGSIPGVIVFDNCNMWSWQSCGLGAGTIQNSHIVVKNCDVRSFTQSYAVDPNPQFANVKEEEEHAKYVHGSRGAIIYHPYSDAKGESNETFSVINSYIYCKNGSHTVQVLRPPENTENSGFKLLTFVDNVFVNDFKFNNDVVVPTGFYLSKNSSGNNISSANNGSNKSYSLTFKD